MVIRDRSPDIVLADFAVKSDQPKPAHIAAIDELISRNALRSPNPRAQFEIVEGYTDMVDTETVNASLRARRAHAIVLAMIDRGVPGMLIGSVRGAPAGQLLADNGNPLGRSVNRAVLLCVVPRQNSPLRTLPASRGSRLWTLTSLVALTIGRGFVGSGSLFQLTDRVHRVSRELTFLGAGVGGGLTIPKWRILRFIRRLTRGLPGMPPRPSVSLPNGVDFHTSRRAQFADFNMKPGVVGGASLGLMAGYGIGFAQFSAMPFQIMADAGGIPLIAPNLYVGTNLLDIGGVQTANLGAEVSVVGGLFQLMNSGVP